MTSHSGDPIVESRYQRNARDRWLGKKCFAVQFALFASQALGRDAKENVSTLQIICALWRISIFFLIIGWNVGIALHFHI